MGISINEAMKLEGDRNT